MSDHRILEHPILPPAGEASVPFTWQGQAMLARPGETIASALFANGIRTFGHHPKDGAPQGIFCANGQCAQCAVVADDLPVKSCMVVVRGGMQVQPLDGLPVLPDVDGQVRTHPIETVDVECLIIGGGPAGLTAAIELGRAGVRALIVDDKHRLGGKLVLQTHKFFGSIEACHAGTRGIDIATKLEREVREFENVRIWLNSTVLSVFSDRRVGVLRDNQQYFIVRPDMLLVTAGAREKSLVFPGNTLPGVYGAGAFQTLVNRDLVRPTERLFVIGGGNVGLIAGYHALQAGIGVVGLCEAMPECGGYKVHKDKLVRMGVPIYTSHTILRAEGKNEVESVTIAEIDKTWRPIPGTEKRFECDTVLVAVGLDPVDEFLHKAREFGLPAMAAGDSEEIAEASAAMFTGRIRGLEIARALGRDVGEVPPEWHRTAEILKSRPGMTIAEDVPEDATGRLPRLPLRAGDPLQSLHLDLPEPRHQHRGRRRAGHPGVRGPRVRRVREVRGHLPRPRHHAGGLPEGPAAADRGHPLRVLGEADQEGGHGHRSRQRGDAARQRGGDAGPRAEGRRSRAARPGDGAGRDRAAHRRHPRPGAVAGGARRAVRAVGRRRRDRVPVRAGDGEGAAPADPGRHPRHEPPEGGHPLRHGRVRRQDLPEPDQTHLQGRGDPGERGHRPHPAAALHGSSARRLRGRGRGRDSDQGRAPATRHRRPRGRHVMSLQVYDAIVVGAGSVGLPTAMFLAEAGLKPLVVDQFAGPGQGSNKAAIGGIRATHSSPAKIRLCLESLRIFSTWTASHGDEIEWFQGGYVFVAYREQDERSLKDLLKIQQSYGLNIRWLDRDEMIALVPDINREGLRGGTYSPEDGSASPMMSSAAFYRRAVELGVQFRFGERVTGLIQRKRGVVGVRTDKGGYATETVVNAAGAWARPLAQSIGLDTPVVPDSHEAGITEPVARFLHPMLVDIRPTEGARNYYFYQHKPGGLVFCITPDPPIVGTDRRETSAYLPMIAGRMVGLVPKLANIKVRRTWRGLYPMTPDGAPVLGWSKSVEGYVHAEGMCGQGFMLGPGVGAVLGRMIRGADTAADKAILEELKPTREFGGEEALK